MKAITVASILTCLALTCGSAAALEINVGGSLGADVSGSSAAGGLSLGLGAEGSVNASVGSRVGGEGTAVDDLGASLTASTSASLTEEDEIATVIRLIESSNWSADSFADVSAVNGTTYDVGAWVDARNEAALDAALDSNADEIADLQAALGANASIDAWLGEHGVEASDVVAIGVAANGSLAVFTN